MQIHKKQSSRSLGFGVETLEGRTLLSATVAVPGTTDLWTLAGLTGAGTGTKPTAISIPAGINRSFSFSGVTGTATANTAFKTNPTADGYPASTGFTTNVTSVGGISGIIDTAPTGTFALIGVFTGNTIPATAPASQNYSNIQNNGSFTPLLDQTFFIGNGKTSKNVLQSFNAPDSATKLYLGFADSIMTFHGAPGGYADDGGSLSATYNIVVHQAVYGSVLSDVAGKAGPGLANWHVYIPPTVSGSIAAEYDTGDTLAITDKNGNFKFSLLAGTYTIAVEIQNGYGIAAPSTYTFKITVGAAPIQGLTFVMKMVPTGL